MTPCTRCGALTFSATLPNRKLIVLDATPTTAGKRYRISTDTVPTADRIQVGPGYVEHGCKASEAPKQGELVP